MSDKLIDALHDAGYWPVNAEAIAIAIRAEMDERIKTAMGSEIKTASSIETCPATGKTHIRKYVNNVLVCIDCGKIERGER